MRAISLFSGVGGFELGFERAGIETVLQAERDAWCLKVLERHWPQRRLTPLECERLMGWPDDWTRWTPEGNEISDSHRYRMAGNGVVATVSEWIGHRLVAVDSWALVGRTLTENQLRAETLEASQGRFEL